MLACWIVTANAVILAAILNVTHSRTYSCAPEDSNVRCEYKTNPEDCSRGESITTTTSPVMKVEYLNVYQFMGSTRSGIVITWNSPNLLTLNRTQGYLLSIYYTNTEWQRTRWKCRHFRIYSVRPSEALYNFSYLEPTLPFRNSRLEVELLTLPFDPSQQEYSSKSVFFKAFGNPSAKFNSNGTADNSSTPYTISTKFKRSSYNHRTDVLYNHTYYNLHLIRPSRGFVYDIDGQKVEPLIFSTSKEEEYASGTFSKIRPGRYNIELWPFKLNYGANTTDIKQVTSWPATVIGSDYKPLSPPKLMLSVNQKLVVSFMAAPSNLFFESYEVVVYNPNRENAASIEPNDSTPNPLSPHRYGVNVTGRPSDSWYVENVTFPTIEIVKLFDIRIRHLMAKVIPTVNTNLCAKRGHCNLDGTCTPCTESVSAAFKLVRPEEGMYSEAQANANVPVAIIAAISTSVSCVLIVLIALLVVRYRHMKHRPTQTAEEVAPLDEPPINQLDDRLTHYSSLNDEISEMFVCVEQLRACVAFAADGFSKAQYEHIYIGLSNIGQKFFGFSPMSLFSEVCVRNSSAMHDFNFILIFCTPELYRIYKEFKTKKCPDKMSQAEMQWWKVRELLVAPQQPTVPVRIMVNLGVLSSEQMKELADEKPKYDLPGQLKQMVTAMHCGGKPSSDDRELTSWTSFIENGGSMYDKLHRDVKQLVSIYKQYEEIKKNYDSGIADESKTVTTDMQIPRMDTQSVGGQPPTTTAQPDELGNDERPSKNVGERNITLTKPQADEMAYLRQNSSDIPAHLRRNVQPQLHVVSDEESIYSVPSSNGDITSVQTIHSSHDWPKAEQHTSGLVIAEESVTTKVLTEKAPLIAYSEIDKGNEMTNSQVPFRVSV